MVNCRLACLQQTDTQRHDITKAHSKLMHHLHPTPALTLLLPSGHDLDCPPAHHPPDASVSNTSPTGRETDPEARVKPQHLRTQTLTGHPQTSGNLVRSRTAPQTIESCLEPPPPPLVQYRCSFHPPSHQRVTHYARCQGRCTHCWGGALPDQHRHIVAVLNSQAIQYECVSPR